MSTLAPLFDGLATVLNIYALLILVRILLTYLRLGSAHPIEQGLRRLVDPVLDQVRRVIPSFGGLDFSPVVAIILCYELAQLLQNLGANAFPNPVAAITSIVLQVAQAILVLVVLLVFVRLVISFLHADPWHPLVFTTRALTDVFVAPFRRRVPRWRTGDSAAVAAFTVLLLALIAVEWLFPIIQQGANRL